MKSAKNPPHILTDTGQTAHFVYHQQVVIFCAAVGTYCRRQSLTEKHRRWYQQLELSDEPPLCSITVFFQQAAHSNLWTYGEADYARYVADIQARPAWMWEPPGSTTQETFLRHLAERQAAFVPIDALINDVTLLVQRLRQVNPTAKHSYGDYHPEKTPIGLQAYLQALHELKEAGTQKACLMIS